MDALWPGQSVTPKALTNRVVQLREALGDNPAAPQIIQTVHRRGYRFCAELASLNSDSEGAPAPPSASTLQSPAGPHFVGRQTELDRLRRRAQLAVEGQRQQVALSGEAGIGKSALLDQFVARARPDGWLPARGQCVALRGDGEAFGPALGLLSDLCSGPLASQVVPLLRRYAPCWLLQLPWLHQAGELARLQRELGGSGPGRMVREGVALLEAVAALQPLLLVVEDLQWADHATLDLLARLMAAHAPARLLLLTSSRPPVEDEAQASASWLALVQRQAATGRGELLALPPLQAADLSAYLQRRYGGQQDWQPTLLHRLVALGGGNPLFVVAMLDHLEDLGWLSNAEGSWALADRSDDGALDRVLPQRLAALLTERAAGLDAHTRRMLEAAAVIGVQFAVPLLAAVCERPVFDIEARCAALARQQFFLQAAAPQRWSDGREVSVFAFSHDLYRQALADALPDGQRRALHERVARSLEHHWRDSPHSVAHAVAEAYVAAALPADAVRVLQVAAGVAAQRFAYQEASQVLRQAQQQLALLPDTPQRARDAVYVHLTQAAVTMTGHGLRDPRVMQSYEAATAMAEQAGTSMEQLRALMGVCMGNVLGGQWERACAAGQRAVALAAAHHPALLAMARTYAGLAEYGAGNLASARQQCELALTTTPAPGLPLFIDVHTMATFHLGRVLCLKGEVGAGIQRMQEAERRVRADGVPFDRIQTLHHVADLWRVLGRPDAARAIFEEVLALAEQHALDYYSRYARTALWSLGQEATAPPDLDDGLAAMQRTGDCWGVTSLSLFVIESLCQRGLVADARRHLQAVQALPSGVPASLRPLQCAARAGVLSLEGANPAVVDAAWAEGFQLAQAQGNRLMQLRLALRRWAWRRQAAWPAVVDEAGATDSARADIVKACSTLRDPAGLSDWAQAQAILGSEVPATASLG